MKTGGRRGRERRERCWVVVAAAGLLEGRSSDEREEEEKDDIEPQESEVSDELNENPEVEIIEARELDREMEAAMTEGEPRREEGWGVGAGTMGNWSSKGAIQVADEVDEMVAEE